ncbi:hypothetical protein BGX21_006640 [Mortierella sp. AD011]|nr:hypothetical protein BGX20_006681 [Mortierella sp. AD010]KAF9368337.1 hypothetical protein BGX21_006640 [Mortierella sp. AD011]
MPLTEPLSPHETASDKLEDRQNDQPTMADLLAAISSMKGRLESLEKSQEQTRPRTGDFHQWRDTHALRSDDDESAEINSSSSSGQRRQMRQTATRHREEPTNNGPEKQEQNWESPLRGDNRFARGVQEHEPSILEGLNQSALSWNQRVVEANKKTFTRKKFDRATQCADEWVEYFRGYLQTHTWDVPEELRNNVAVRMLGQALTDADTIFWFTNANQRNLSCWKMLDEFEEDYTPTHIKQQSSSIEGIRACK